MAHPRFDHAVIVVSNLRRAVAEFESQGFRVRLGGRTGPVHNALVIFRDGTYLELTTTRFLAARVALRALGWTGALDRIARRRNDIFERFIPWLGAAVGPIDWCIRVDNLASVTRQLRHAGFDMFDPRSFERTRPDGQVARWRLGGPRNRRLPFFIEDETPIEVRIPGVESAFHENGAVGIRTLELPDQVAADVTTMVNALAPQLGSDPLENIPLSPSDARDVFAVQLVTTGQPIDLDTTKTSSTRIQMRRAP
ncbi:MAG: VOC family protein [Myxococcota bacterium]